MLQVSKPKSPFKWPRWWPVVALGLVLLIAGAVWNTGWVQDATATYVKYNSAGEVADKALLGDRVTAPLTISSRYDNFEVETDRKGLIVEAPQSGFEAGTHIYYLQIYNRETKLGLHARPGDPAGLKTFWIAVVKRIE